jgi:hypothetical protein
VLRMDSSPQDDSNTLLFVSIECISVESWPVCCVFWNMNGFSEDDIMVNGHFFVLCIYIYTLMLAV